MQRDTGTSILALATVAAAAAIWLWVLVPLGPASYLSKPGETDTEIIRRYWPHRLVQPEWIADDPEGLGRLMNWPLVETGTRLAVVGLLWFSLAGGVLVAMRRRKQAAGGTRK